MWCHTTHDTAAICELVIRAHAQESMTCPSIIICLLHHIYHQTSDIRQQKHTRPNTESDTIESIVFITIMITNVHTIVID